MKTFLFLSALISVVIADYLDSDELDNAIQAYLNKESSAKIPQEVVVPKSLKLPKVPKESLKKSPQIIVEAPVEVSKSLPDPDVDDPSGDVVPATKISPRKLPFKAVATSFNKCVSPKMFALTFDEGPNYSNTKTILKTLKEKGVEATFHICAQYLPGARDLVKAILNDGHLLGMRFNPKVTDLRELSEAQIHRYLRIDQKIIYDNTGIRVRYLRLPYGGFGERELKIIVSLGFIVTEHNLESYDYQEGKIMSAFKAKLYECKVDKCPGLISVQREGSDETTKRLRAVIDLIDRAGYVFVKLDKCIRA